MLSIKLDERQQQLFHNVLSSAILAAACGSSSPSCRFMTGTILVDLLYTVLTRQTKTTSQPAGISPHSRNAARTTRRARLRLTALPIFFEDTTPTRAMPRRFSWHR